MMHMREQAEKKRGGGGWRGEEEGEEEGEMKRQAYA